MWKIYLLLLFSFSCHYASIDDSFSPSVPKCQQQSEIKELTKERIPNKEVHGYENILNNEPCGYENILNQEPCGYQLPSQDIKQPVLPPSICGGRGCLPSPKKICPAPTKKTTCTSPSNNKPPLLVCLLPTQPQPQPPKPTTCTTTTTNITDPCITNLNKPIQPSCSKPMASISESKKVEEKGIIPLVKSLFSSSKPAPTATIANNNTAACNSTLTEKKNSTNAISPKLNCSVTGLYPEPAAIPPAVYEILSRIAKEHNTF